jgi:hypothetical protein
MSEERRLLQGALTATFLREWNNADLDAEARQYIVEEAAKLFGGGRRGGGRLTSLLGAGARPRKSRTTTATRTRNRPMANRRQAGN